MVKRSVRSAFIFALLVLLLQACSMPGTATPTPMLGEPPIGPLTLYVSTTGDDGNDCLSDASPCLTVYNALRLSTPGSLILIGPGEFTRNGSLSPRHDVTLRGAGMDQTILTNPTGDVLQMTRAERVTIRDLTVSGAGPDVPRNGIEVREGVTLILENCRIRNNYYGIRLFRGAAATVSRVFVEENYYGLSSFGELSLSESTFSRNLIGLANYGLAQVNNVTFDDNGHFSADSGASSATIDNGLDGQLTVSGGTISNSSGYGITINGGSVLLDGVEVYGNSGIAVWHIQGLLEVRSSVVRDNGVYGIAVGGRSGVPSVGTVNVHETAVVRNGSAGVRIDGGDVTLQNVTVSGNVATTSGGGGIWMYGGNLFLLNSTVVFNTGHGIESGPAGDVPAVVTVRRSVIALNSAEECYTTGPSTADTGSRTYGRYQCTEASQASLGLGDLTSDAGTLVHPLLPGSPLIDAGGPPALCAVVDQRGFGRPAGSTCDVGAYEFDTTTAALVLATPGESATPDIVPLPTATPGFPVFTFLQNANCRKGPGTQYDVVTALEQGTVADVVGRNEQSNWWLIRAPDSQARCWVSGTTGEGSGALDGLPVEAGEPLPGTPAGFVIGQALCSPNLNYYFVPLGWSDGNGETGYRLYRNGSLVATLGANTVYYEDQAPKGVDLLYELEAFNTAGVSGRVQVNLAACP